MLDMTLDSRCLSHRVRLNCGIDSIIWRSSELTWIWKSRREVMNVRDWRLLDVFVLTNNFVLVKIDLSVVKDDWIKSGGPFQVRKLAEHYQIFEHLFGKHAFFTPRVSMDIKFKISDDVYCPVYHGNVSSKKTCKTYCISNGIFRGLSLPRLLMRPMSFLITSSQ